MNLTKAISLIKQGKIIITPSESSYGFSCSALNPSAVQKIHKIKQEPSDKPLIVAISNLKQLSLLNASLPSAFIPLTKLPITLIVQKSTGGTLAFRIPHNKILKTLCSQIPIVTTSCNLHSTPPLYNIDEVKSQFQEKVSLIIDSGNLPRKDPSTIYNTITGKIIRKGSISQEEITKYLKPYQ